MARARIPIAVFGLALCGMLAAAAPAMAGSISGTVTDDSPGHSPIEGIRACARIEPFTIEETCAETNSSGGYALGGLAQGLYRVHFSDVIRNRNYVDQYFDGEVEYSTADLVTIGASEDRTIDVEMQQGGTISGAVTDALSTNPVAGFPVCAFAITPGGGEIGRCSHTGSNGQYAINGLAPEEYEVEFIGEGAFNYMTQYYDGAESTAAATRVSIESPGDVKASIDAELEAGAEISGVLTEAGTGTPLFNVDVALLAPVTEEVLRVIRTGPTGHYAFRGRPAGTYIVGFSHTLFGPFNEDCYSTQYYRGASDFAGASSLTVSPPDVLNGIDGEVVNYCPEARPQPIQRTILPIARPPGKKCRRGFHKKKVKGRKRCVKKHKKHRQGRY